ncbi:hypothetical protein Pyrde_1117 [Pyrodictium delaneyi]|uniref:Uncharacterized protein n=1 Tax=Pyrodictium delaneyi TaxID=1273541 RepID=A0A0P0N4M8_9CREN|nr:hypothetical protein [Pyrodictium delaneyi]ALL01165.1 hypothetical protein Pyrde_1117 [Pyrodictium delaneyi]OWJ55262.1 hypothetical protein Pdsh_00055 [Pyrodictium delaneyi]
MLNVRIEMSKSRSGKHAVRSLALLVSEKGDIVEPRPRMTQREKPLYSRGSAYIASISVPKGWYLVYVYLVKNLRGHVKGYIEVYSPDAQLLYRAVYRKLKLRYSAGDPRYAWIVQKVVDYLKLPVKNMNLGEPS